MLSFRPGSAINKGVSVHFRWSWSGLLTSVLMISHLRAMTYVICPQDLRGRRKSFRVGNRNSLRGLRLAIGNCASVYRGLISKGKARLSHACATHACELPIANGLRPRALARGRAMWIRRGNPVVAMDANESPSAVASHGF